MEKAKIKTCLREFIRWLNSHGEVSYDHQSFFAGPIGGKAKSLYYRKPMLGTLAVSPMIFFEAFFPSARTLFWKEQRFPIADAHYAMGFGLLAQAGEKAQYYERAVHFLEELKKSRAPGFQEFCWGYPFDWVTRNGTIPAGTPFITTLPYVYEAFDCVFRYDGHKHWLEVMYSIAEHAQREIRDFEVSPGVFSCGYGPYDEKGGVVNAAAYRAFLLTSAYLQFGEERYQQTAEGNLRFVIGSQRPDGSWPYAVDEVRDFVDHFHTCFILKALAKIERLTGHEGCRRAIERGIGYYQRRLLDEKGLPKPFSVAPRLTVYRRELYDYAECINLCLLLRDKNPGLQENLKRVVNDVLERWIKKDGSFRSRELLIGWDNVPMHRWAQAQMFRSLCFLLYKESVLSKLPKRLTVVP